MYYVLLSICFPWKLPTFDIYVVNIIFLDFVRHNWYSYIPYGETEAAVGGL